MINKEFNRWLAEADTLPYADKDVISELDEMKNSPEAKESAFYRSLAFGTGGLRGIIGAGTNRMNVYTVAKASQGLADYINSSPTKKRKSIAVSYDSRIKSDLFASVAAGVFAANGIYVHLYPHLAPTPALSFAVRHFGCDAGVMVTASHNPAKYNGYKVYGSDGCQITEDAAEQILEKIENTDIFTGVRYISLDDGIKNADIAYINEDVENEFIKCVLSASVLGDIPVNRDIPIVYTPLCGTGLMFVQRALSLAGFTNISVVKEQEAPNGTFPSCPYPNPEIKEAMALGIRDAKESGAELLLATDPDCDRVGIAVRRDDGEYVLLTGNEVGVLLLDYICTRRKALGNMPDNPVCIKTIVTTDMAERVATSYGVKTLNVLTGFKYIGEEIGRMESLGCEGDFILGFEESYGYLAGSYVRDKDGVVAALLITEMLAYYKSLGEGLYEHLEALYEQYGYTLNTLYSYEFEGSAGEEKMKSVMSAFRNGVKSVGGCDVLTYTDYKNGINGLPKSDVLKFALENNCFFTVRPSGTEPKLKIYLSVSSKNLNSAEKLEQKLKNDIEKLII